jgi:hypothetical protein
MHAHAATLPATYLSMDSSLVDEDVLTTVGGRDETVCAHAYAHAHRHGLLVAGCMCPHDRIHAWSLTIDSMLALTHMRSCNYFPGNVTSTRLSRPHCTQQDLIDLEGRERWQLTALLDVEPFDRTRDLGHTPDTSAAKCTDRHQSTSSSVPYNSLPHRDPFFHR